MMNFDVSSVIKTGTKMTVQKLGTKADTAINYGTQKLDTLIATPIYVEMVIEASTGLVDRLLPEGIVSVGTKIEIEHNAPAILGMNVFVDAAVERVEGNTILITCVLRDDAGVIGSAHHERVITVKEKLLDRAKERLLEKTKA